MPILSNRRIGEILVKKSMSRKICTRRCLIWLEECATLKFRSMVTNVGKKETVITGSNTGFVVEVIRILLEVGVHRALNGYFFAIHFRLSIVS